MPDREIHDRHAHVHDPEVIRSRDQFADSDAWFAVQNPPGTRRLSSPRRLLRAMEVAGVSRADALSFGWRDHAQCVARNDAVIEMRRALAAADSSRLRWFGAVNPAAGRLAAEEVARLAAHGFCGVGELFPDGQGFDVTDRATMAPFLEVCDAHNFVVLIHASDPDGPAYAGRDTTVPAKVSAFLEIVGEVAPELRLVMAHLGGGLPFYADDVEVRRSIERTHVIFDTAACAYLYPPTRLREAHVRCPGRIVFGSDHPISALSKSLRWVRDAHIDPHDLRA